MKINIPLSLTGFLLSIFLSSCFTDPPRIPADAYACSFTSPNTHPEGDRFQANLEAKVAEGLPGISMLIETPEGHWAGAAGLADIPNEVPMETCHQHLIGSITKVFTAVLIHQLAEEGELALSDSISQYLSREIRDRVPNANSSTIKDLLRHTSGIPEFLDIPFSLAAAEQPRKAFTAEEILEFVYPLSSVFPAGTKVAYSNTNYTLLGLIAEHITGQRGETLYQERIFSPLGMTNTFFDQDGGIPTGISRAYLDRYDNNRIVDVTETNAIRSSMAGGIVSTPEDMLRFARALFNDGSLLSTASRRNLLTFPEVPFEEPGDFEFGEDDRVRRLLGFGSGLISLETTEGPAIGFNGGYQGRKARMWYWPAEEKLVIFFINGSGGEINESSRRLFRSEMVTWLFD